MSYSQVRQNARLLIGVSSAMLLSVLSLTSLIGRIPTLLVILRRKLRRAVSEAKPQLRVADNPDQLWQQNNSLPGNRGDGFRFRYLLFFIVATPIYLWFELSFGVNLLDIMGGDKPPEATDSIEHWGRIISGIAVALVFLKGWLEESEKWKRSWTLRIIVSIAICVFSIVMTWIIQDAVIEFYIKRGKSEVAIALGALVTLAVGGILMLKFWLRRSVLKRRSGLVPTLAGLVVIVALGSVLITNLNTVLNAVARQFGISERLAQSLGSERQQAATLTLVRRGLQQGIYSVEGLLAGHETAHSAEGKTALALFPIVAAGMDQSHFAADRAVILHHVMYRDWNEQYGEGSYNAFIDIVRGLEEMHAGAYRKLSDAYPANVAARGRAAADVQWDRDVRDLLTGGTVSPGLNLANFMSEPAIPKYIGKALGCFDCVFRAEMKRDEVTRELFKWTQAINVSQALTTLESAEHFESSRDGETAARTYWVPIWALLFSMVGAFTHLFKMAFTLTEYAQRRTFHRARASDSALANSIVWNAKILIAIGILGLMLFIFFSDNRVTGNETYVRLHDRMWRTEPLVGALAAHWTINAQALIYPFTKKIRPDWLVFSNDPLDWLPIKRKEDEY